jgi:lipopolysaccharide transport system permease protein
MFRGDKSFGQEANLGSTFAFFELVWVKALLNIKAELHRSYLSYGWWVIEPLLHMGVFFVVFGMLLKRGEGDFLTFLLTGLIPWMWFMKGVTVSSNSILNGDNVLRTVRASPAFFPLASVVQTTLKQIPVMAILLSLVVFRGHIPSVHWFALAPVMLTQLALTAFVSCLVAAIIPFFRDLAFLVPTGLQFIMFLSGTFYDYRTIPIEWQGLFLLNPMAFLLKCYRDIFLENTWPQMDVLAMWFASSLLLCLITVYVMNKLRHIYPRVIV